MVAVVCSLLVFVLILIVGFWWPDRIADRAVAAQAARDRAAYDPTKPDAPNPWLMHYVEPRDNEIRRAVLGQSPRKQHEYYAGRAPDRPAQMPTPPHGTPIPKPLIARRDEGRAYSPACGPASPAPWGVHGPSSLRYDGMTGRAHSPQSQPPHQSVIAKPRGTLPGLRVRP